VFTIEERDALRERVLALAQDDERVVAGALVGSLAVEGGDRFSDVDLTFAVAGDVVGVLDDLTRMLEREDGAVRLADLERGPTIYRVFLFPGALQLDLSMTPAASFHPGGPRFKLLFGEPAAGEPASPAKPPALFIPTPAIPSDIFGWGVIYALHARACIERGRFFQAEHYVGAVRDHALALACLREGVTAAQARGYDDLSDETLAQFKGVHVSELDAVPLRSALGACVKALLREGKGARLPHANVVAERLEGVG
jgi:hypothetical protein